MALSKRDHLVETALDLFYAQGFHATGIDAILAEADVAKMTLYNHFKSKDDLIVAALRRHAKKFGGWILKAMEGRENRAKPAHERLLVLFDVLADWFRSDDFQGCVFVHAAYEYLGDDDPIHRAARDQKEQMRMYVLGLAKEAGAADPMSLAQGLVLLIEGATVMAHVAGDPDAAENAKAAAAALIRDAGL
jgi:AcrR family transcriptional regulator